MKDVFASLRPAIQALIRAEVAIQLKPIKAELDRFDELILSAFRSEVLLDLDDKRDLENELSELREDLEHRVGVVAADVDDLSSGLRNVEGRVGDLECDR